MKTLITGITGMIGAHWAREALARGWPVFGIDRTNRSELVPEEIRSNIHFCDILDGKALQRLIIDIKPELVIHLAAQSFNSLSWDLEELTHSTNTMGTLKLLQAIRQITPRATVFLASSSVVYGAVNPVDCPLTEDRPLKPVTPYAVTKACNEHLGYQYFKNFNLKVFLPRFFGLLGPGHPPNTAVQNFARQLALIARNKRRAVLKVGNLETARDYLDVRDGISGMLALLKKGKPGEPVNICSGIGIQISKLLNMLIDISGLEVTIEKDSALSRPSDEPLLFGDNTRLRGLGWEACYSTDETLRSIYEDWLIRIERGE